MARGDRHAADGGNGDAMGRKQHPDWSGAGSSAAGGGEDHARFSAIVLPLLHEAYALARSLTGNRTDAEDVVQDACVRAFRAIGGITSDNPRAWLLTIVRNAAFTWLGRNRQPMIVMVEDLEVAERLAPPDARRDDETPESALIAKTETAELEAAIAELPIAVPRDPGPARDSWAELPRDQRGHGRADRNGDVPPRPRAGAPRGVAHGPQDVRHSIVCPVVRPAPRARNAHDARAPALRFGLDFRFRPRSWRKPVDLGIAGKTALVCAASKGLGKGCALALAREGVHVTILARGTEALEATAAEIRAAAPKVKVTTVASDITTAAGRAAALAACPKPDILVNNAGGPPPGDFKDWDRDTWIKAIDANMLTPIELIKATIDHMVAQRFGRVINITSAAVKEPIPELGLSNGRAHGLDRVRVGHRAPLRAAQRDHQQPAARPVRHRPPALELQAQRGEGRHRRRRAPRAPDQDRPRRPLRHAGRVRRVLRLPVQRPRRLHDRAERPARRRALSGHVLSEPDRAADVGAELARPRRATARPSGPAFGRRGRASSAPTWASKARPHGAGFNNPMSNASTSCSSVANFRA
jgi:3-oxoacyl-[acyl-carrier protein] reductase